MYDAALYFGGRVAATGPLLSEIGVSAHNYVLATVHRAENTDDSDRLSAVVDGLTAVSESLSVVWPLHPRTRDKLSRSGHLSRIGSNVHIIDPVGYLDMVQLEKYAAVIATDSGGVQKEAFFYQVPCVTIRDETEWLELIEAGWNRLAPPVSGAAVADAVLSAVGSAGELVTPYGTGDAAIRIVSHLERWGNH
jgi:UDP-GlcNAc3NAcA epimerase